MGGKKVRFAARVDGDLRELFSVDEKASGDLTIIRRAEAYEFQSLEETERAKVLTHRISVHRSQRSAAGGTTLIYTMINDKDVTERGASFIKNSSKDRLIWPVYSTLCPELRHERYTPSTGKTKQIVELAQDIPPDRSFMYHVFVASLKVDLPEILFCTRHAVRFKHFQVVVYANHFNFPPTAVGIHASILTSDRTLNGEAAGLQVDFEKVFPQGAVSVRPGEIEHVVWTFCNELNLAAARVMLSHPMLDDDGRDVLRNFEPLFTRHPIKPGRVIWMGDKPHHPWSPPVQTDEA